MAQLGQACSCKTAQDTSSYSELATGVDSCIREHQEKTKLVTGIRYVHIIRRNLVISLFNCFSAYSETNGLLQKINSESSQIYFSVLIHAPRNELLVTSTSVGPNLQPIVITENTCPPLQETDPSCSGVMTLNDCDIVVQR